MRIWLPGLPAADPEFTISRKPKNISQEILKTLVCINYLPYLYRINKFGDTKKYDYVKCRKTQGAEADDG